MPGFMWLVAVLVFTVASATRMTNETSKWDTENLEESNPDFVESSSNSDSSSDIIDESERVEDSPVDPKDIDLSAPELIKKYGFPVQIHTVISDGYILTHHRIPRPGSFPIFLSHGILCSSRDWLMQRGQKALAYQLYNAGYDVWLENRRGNNYSMRYVNNSLNPNDLAFWNFAIDEISLNDVPRNIDYVLKVTNRTKLGWIGYSLGTTTLFAGLISKPEYQKKLEFFIGLAPVTVNSNTKSRVTRILADLTRPEEPLKSALVALGRGRFMPSMILRIINDFVPGACSSPINRPDFCSDSYAIFGGFNPKQTDRDMQPVIFGGFPSPVSVRMLVQLLQGIINGAGLFRRYNFQNPIQNIQMYGSVVPPSFDLTKFQVPTYLIAGKNDYIAPPEDVAVLVDRLPKSSLKCFMEVSDPSWNHLDFLFGKDAKPLVYDVVISQIKNHLSTLTPSINSTF